MRRELARQLGQRKKFRGTFDRIGKKTGYRGNSADTILLRNIIDLESGRIVSDHIWFNYTKGFEDARLILGAIIGFEARIKEYSKGYVNSRYRINHQRKDYKLSHPTKIRMVTT